MNTGRAISRMVRRSFLSASTATALNGCLNCDQRVSSALTYSSTPTSAVIMNWNTTEAGTGALSSPINGGSSGMPN